MGLAGHLWSVPRWGGTLLCSVLSMQASAEEMRSEADPSGLDTQGWIDGGSSDGSAEVVGPASEDAQGIVSWIGEGLATVKVGDTTIVIDALEESATVIGPDGDEQIFDAISRIKAGRYEDILSYKSERRLESYYDEAIQSQADLVQVEGYAIDPVSFKEEAEELVASCISNAKEKIEVGMLADIATQGGSRYAIEEHLIDKGVPPENLDAEVERFVQTAKLAKETKERERAAAMDRLARTHYYEFNDGQYEQNLGTYGGIIGAGVGATVAGAARAGPGGSGAASAAGTVVGHAAGASAGRALDEHVEVLGRTYNPEDDPRYDPRSLRLLFE